MATPNTRRLDNRSGLDTEATRRAAELAERLYHLVTEHGTPRRMSWGKGFQTVLQCTTGRLTVRLFHNNRFLAAYWHAESEAPSPENQVFIAKAGLSRGGTTYTVKREAGYEAVCARLLPIGQAKPTFTPPLLYSHARTLPKTELCYMPYRRRFVHVLQHGTCVTVHDGPEPHAGVTMSGARFLAQCERGLYLMIPRGYTLAEAVRHQGAVEEMQHANGNELISGIPAFAHVIPGGAQ